MRQMDTQLVGASGQRPKSDKRHFGRDAFDNLIKGEGALASCVCVSSSSAICMICPFLIRGGVNAAFLWIWDARRRSPIDFLRCARLKGRCQFHGGKVVAGDQKDTACVAIQSVHQFRARDPIRTEDHQAVVQVFLKPCAALYSEASRFVERNHIGIFIEDESLSFSALRIGRLVGPSASGLVNALSCESTGGRRRLCPACNRVDDSARLPSTRICPVRSHF